MVFGKKQIKVGKMLITLLITAVIAGFIFGIELSILEMLTGFSGVLIGGIGALLIFFQALKLKQGKESFLDIIPVLIVSGILTEIFALMGRPITTVSLTGITLGLMISSVFLSMAIVEKWIIKK